jgi:hypothetical protein
MTREAHGTVGLQMGSNKYCTQSGMMIGGVRHVADIRADQLDQQGQGVIGTQMGYPAGATQTGMQIGGRRNLYSLELLHNKAG